MLGARGRDAGAERAGGRAKIRTVRPSFQSHPFSAISPLPPAVALVPLDPLCNDGLARCQLQRAPGLHLHRLLARRTVPVSPGLLPRILRGWYRPRPDDGLTSAKRSQVLENVRNQSVEGLALPFLMNWLLGECAFSPPSRYIAAIARYVA